MKYLLFVLAALILAVIVICCNFLYWVIMDREENIEKEKLLDEKTLKEIIDDLN